MKASELMIGDWVKLKDGGPFQMEDVSGTCMFKRWTSDGEYMIPYGYDEIEPIPITPEILEKNGFKKDNDDIWPRYIFVADIEKSPQTIIAFSFYGKGVSAETLFKCWTRPKSCDGENNIHICDLKFVHELQHALRICGIDKEIVV